jgi:hypothetical protein
MTWLTPAYAIIAASVAVPALLILYFLKLRRRDVEVSTTLLWKKAIQDLQANAPFQRLRRNILLILQLIALGAILTALGQPQIKRQTMTGQRHVILIDRSASMQAADEDDGKGGKITRFEAARRQAIALVESMREGGLFDNEKDAADQAMVIAFDTQAEVRQQLTSDKAALRRAIESITPTEGPTLIDEAIRLAKAQQKKKMVEGREIEGLTADEPFTIHIYSDGRIADAQNAAPGPEDDVQFHRVGSPESGNAAIVGLRAERSFDNPGRLSVFVSLQNSDPEARSVDVELVVNGQGAGIKAATIPGATPGGVRLSAGEAARAAAAEKAASQAAGQRDPAAAPAPEKLSPGIGGVVFSLERGEGALVQVRLRSPGSGEALGEDALELDNRGWLVVPPAKRVAVAVVSPRGNLFLTTALEGLPLSRLVSLTPAQFQQKAREETLGEYDVVVLDGWLPAGCRVPPAEPPAASEAPQTPAGKAPAPASADPGEVLPPGRYLILGEVPLRLTGEAGSGLRLSGEPGSAGIIDWSRDHPVLRGLSLDGLLIAKMQRAEVVTGGPAVAVASADIGPALFDIASGDTRALVVPFDVAESNWPFHVSFVVFMAGATAYLGDDAATGGSGRNVQPGSVLSDRVPAGVGEVEMKTPTGETQKRLAAPDGRIVFGPLDRSGVYEVSWAGPGGPTDQRSGDRAVRLFAANLFDPAESDLAATDRVDLASKEVAALGRGSALADRKIWPWLLLGALAVIMLEWFVYNKKVHV